MGPCHGITWTQQSHPSQAWFEVFILMVALHPKNYLHRFQEHPVIFKIVMKTFERWDTWTNPISHAMRLGAPEAAHPQVQEGGELLHWPRSNQPSHPTWVENTGVTSPWECGPEKSLGWRLPGVLRGNSLNFHASLSISLINNFILSSLLNSFFPISN